MEAYNHLVKLVCTGPVCDNIKEENHDSGKCEESRRMSSSPDNSDPPLLPTMYNLSTQWLSTSPHQDDSQDQMNNKSSGHGLWIFNAFNKSMFCLVLGSHFCKTVHVHILSRNHHWRFQWLEGEEGGRVITRGVTFFLKVPDPSWEKNNQKI